MRHKACGDRSSLIFVCKSLDMIELNSDFTLLGDDIFSQVSPTAFEKNYYSHCYLKDNYQFVNSMAYRNNNLSFLALFIFVGHSILFIYNIIISLYQYDKHPIFFVFSLNQNQNATI